MIQIHKLFLLLILSFVVFSCVDRDFDEPPFPSVEDPSIRDDQVISIADLKALRGAGEVFHEVAKDKYLKASVIGDDQSGNIYKSLVLQDDSGGISILLDDVELWNRYFVGKRVFVHLQDIWLGDYNNLPQIGFEPVGGSMARIPAELIPQVLSSGITVGQPEPKIKTIATLGPADYNTLIRLENVELSSGSVDVSWADAVTPAAVNHTLEDCNGISILIRTSGFSNFAEEITPGGKGTVTAVLGVFGTDLQLTLRDLNDVSLDGDRCDGSGNGSVEVDPSKVITIQDVLAMRVAGAETNIGTDQYIKGSIVSSDETGNFFKSLTVSDESGGIAILVNKFDLHQDYEFGSVVYVHLQDLFISDYNGLPQLGYAASTEVVKRIPESVVRTIILSSNENIALAPISITVDQIDEAYINRYVEFTSMEFVDTVLSKSYAISTPEKESVNHPVINCNGNRLLVRTSGFADFADDVVPNGNGTIKGVLQVFGNDYQLILNYPEDVRFNGSRCDGTNGGGPGTGTGNAIYKVDFQTQSDNDDISIEGWLNVATKGDRLWRQKIFEENGYAQATAFQDMNAETESWLVSPAINTTEKSTLSFSSAKAFYKHDGLTVLYSTDFSDDVEAATWTTIEATLAVESSTDHAFIESGDIDLEAFGTNIHIAFRYQGTGASNTTSYRVDDIDIR